MNETSGIGPWGTTPGSGTYAGVGRPLRIFFVHDYARAVIYSAATMAFLMIVIGFVRQDVMLMILSLLPIGVTSYHLPAMQNTKPQLIVSDSGIFVDGLGEIPWSEVTDAELVRPGSENSSDAELVISTSEALEYIIHPQLDLTLLRTFQIMIWRLEEVDVIRLHLGALNVDPAVLFEDVRRRRRGLHGWDA